MSSLPESPEPVPFLDLRTTKCPLNFVKTKLALEKLPPGSFLEVLIDAGGQSAINIPQSIRQEGHSILAITEEGQGIQRIRIQRKAL